MERELSPMEKEVREHLVNILKDSLEDSKKVVKRLQATIVLLIVLLVGSFVFFTWNFISFVSGYDIESTITTTTNNSNKTFDKNSSINAHINDIKVNANKLK